MEAVSLQGVKEPKRQYICEATLMVTAADENDAYAQISDSGISADALVGTVLVLSLDPLREETWAS